MNFTIQRINREENYHETTKSREYEYNSPDWKENAVNESLPSLRRKRKEGRKINSLLFVTLNPNQPKWTKKSQEKYSRDVYNYNGTRDVDKETNGEKSKDKSGSYIILDRQILIKNWIRCQKNSS